MEAWVLVAVAVLAIIPGLIAHQKGRRFIVWWVFGVALFIVALPCALLVKPTAEADKSQLADEGLRRCPSCSELVLMDAATCHACGRELPNEDSGQTVPGA
jgi:hypothetical protein